MTGVIGYDAIHDDVASIPLSAQVVMGYDTGSPEIQWTPEDWARFPHARHVHIDQGFTGSPVPTATVRDVEAGAWVAENAVRDTANWNAGRPTIYCNRDTLPRVLSAGWKGDLWLAIPNGIPPTAAPIVPGCTVVAVQFSFDGATDRSVLFDRFWPAREPAVPGTEFAAPNLLQETATASFSWAAVNPVGDRKPTGYTVSVLGLDGHEYAHTVTENNYATISGLTRGWTYNVHVWANGGDIAPPHASLTIHT